MGGRRAYLRIMSGLDHVHSIAWIEALLGLVAVPSWILIHHWRNPDKTNHRTLWTVFMLFTWPLGNYVYGLIKGNGLLRMAALAGVLFTFVCFYDTYRSAKEFMDSGAAEQVQLLEKMLNNNLQDSDLQNLLPPEEPEDQ